MTQIWLALWPQVPDPLQTRKGGTATPALRRIRFFKLRLRANRVPFTAILITCLYLVLLRVWSLGG